MNAVLLATEQWGHNLYGICICDFQNIYTYEKSKAILKVKSAGLSKQ